MENLIEARPGQVRLFTTGTKFLVIGFHPWQNVWLVSVQMDDRGIEFMIDDIINCRVFLD